MRKGYTTGVWDLFHIGHLNILQRAREMCDYLIVGVSTDALVQAYKGHPPSIPFAERLAIVGAVKYVDEVVAQETMDKCEAHDRLQYNIMFHGDDWKNSTLYQQAEADLKARGVEFVYFPYTQGTTSTLLSEALRNSLKK